MDGNLAARPSRNSVRFVKMHGVGNDFVLVDARDGAGRNWAALAPPMCDRHTGIGADGLLVVETCPTADVWMRMYNPDGTPDVCGNGLRCLARYVADQVNPDVAEARLTIGTIAGVRNAEVMRLESSGVMVTVDMGEPRFEPSDVPIDVQGVDAMDVCLDLGSSSLCVSALSTGSTHAVTFVDALPEDRVFLDLSPRVEMHPVFPERTSLMWVVCEGSDRLRMRIWERGVGETLGCGTGACAAAVVARRRGLVGSRVDVKSRGGVLTVEWDEGSTIRQTGPAEYVFLGEYLS